MKRTLITLSFIFLIQLTFSQSTVSIRGKIIDESFFPLPAVSIIVDEKEVALSDFDGKFQIEINKNVQKIVFQFIGMESLTVHLKENCNNLEIVLLNEGGCYLGASLQKVNRIRKRRFDNRKKIHKTAYQKGIFSTENFCGEPEFKPL
jgi:hypothetical protein